MKGSITGKVVDWENGETMDQMLDQFGPWDYTGLSRIILSRLWTGPSAGCPPSPNWTGFWRSHLSLKPSDHEAHRKDHLVFWDFESFCHLACNIKCHWSIFCMERQTKRWREQLCFGWSDVFCVASVVKEGFEYQLVSSFWNATVNQKSISKLLKSLTATSISAITMMGMPSEYYVFGSTVAWGLIAEFIGNYHIRYMLLPKIQNSRNFPFSWA